MTAFDVEKKAMVGDRACAVLVVSTLRKYRSAAQALSNKVKSEAGMSAADVEVFVATVLEAESDLSAES